ncbi:MAG: hypothetical protein NUW09_08210 [Deltaproteobacteria bacterium]|nr:hypothetical protein [Deltaproteobacteria bacterium]
MFLYTFFKLLPKRCRRRLKKVIYREDDNKVLNEVKRYLEKYRKILPPGSYCFVYKYYDMFLEKRPYLPCELGGPSEDGVIFAFFEDGCLDPEPDLIKTSLDFQKRLIVFMDYDLQDRFDEIRERVAKETRKFLDEYRKTLAPDIYYFIEKNGGVVLEREPYPSWDTEARSKYGVIFAYFEYDYPDPDPNAIVRCLPNGWIEQTSPSSTIRYRSNTELKMTSFGFQRKIVDFIRNEFKNNA